MFIRSSKRHSCYSVFVEGERWWIHGHAWRIRSSRVVLDQIENCTTVLFNMTEISCSLCNLQVYQYMHETITVNGCPEYQARATAKVGLTFCHWMIFVQILVFLFNFSDHVLITGKSMLRFFLQSNAQPCKVGNTSFHSYTATQPMRIVANCNTSPRLRGP